MTQRSLTALRIGNFKAFADTQRIPLKPITLIFGPNSAGKSSLIQSLAFAHQAQLGRDMHGRQRLDVHATEIGGDSIELGGFRQFVHRRDPSRRVSWGAELTVAGLGNRLRELLDGVKQVAVTVSIGVELDDQDRAKPGAAPRVDSVELLADGAEILHMSRRQTKEAAGLLRVDRLATSHHVWRTIFQAIVESTTTATTVTDDDWAGVDAAVAGLLPELDVLCPRLLPSTVKLRNVPVEGAPGAELLVPVARGTRTEDIARALRTYLPGLLDELVTGLEGHLCSQLGRFHYLGPVRERPTRHAVAPEQRDANWAAGGGFAWELLTHDGAVRERVNQWLGGHPGKSRLVAQVEAGLRPDGRKNWMRTPYELIVDGYVANSDLDNALVAAFYERPLTLLQRRELLTKDFARVCAELQEQYETDQARAEDYAKQLEPWIERIQHANSPDDADRILTEAMDHFEAIEAERRDSPEGQQEAYEEMMAEDAPMDAAIQRAGDFMQVLKMRGAATREELRLRDLNRNTPVALCDVGFGVSQVLPVLTLAYASQNDLIAMEQPEIHLHPALQAELADVFIESALGERQNTFILETHSEHVILRLLRRIRETTNGELPKDFQPLRPDDLQILYAQPEGTLSRIMELSVDTEGEFVGKWPGGFFPERAKELF
ncbi:AAA family ATPase [Rhodanobacter lindaniclasticus]|uniref:AAA domain-containing protein n=2 Tax=Lysobacterales TaxID=135614 RepID=A0A4V3UT84_9GAMM|nr:AAA family ATPase [Rhodanobacter lindaniclasticus]THD09651.1 hypothetical protein B1991_01825 [Rhodanobacter lindaniclasticus]